MARHRQAHDAEFLGVLGIAHADAKLDPTVINGGIVNRYGTNTRLGTGEWLVAESDESDGTFTRLPATVAVITNIDPEHMEHYGSFDAVREPVVGTFTVRTHDGVPSFAEIAKSGSNTVRIVWSTGGTAAWPGHGMKR